MRCFVLQLRNLLSCLDKLRGYKSLRLKMVCYYHSFITSDVVRARYDMERGYKVDLLYRIYVSRDVIEQCFNNGLLQHGTELKAMQKTLDIYEKIVERHWLLVRLYDLLIKK